jgi:dynein heavy chain
VTLAKQRLGPTIQEESKSIIKDLKLFAIVIDDLHTDIMDSYLFQKKCESEGAFVLLTQFSDRFQSLQNKADDLRQLQELLESDIVDFEKLIRSKKVLFFLEQTWKAISEIKQKHNEWKTIRWQKVILNYLKRFLMLTFNGS